MRIKKKNVGNFETSNLENIILHIFFFLLSITFLYPVLLVIAVSFTEQSSLLQYGYRLMPKVFTLDAYRIALGTGDILNAYKVTIGSTICGTVLGLFIMLLYAYPLSRKNFKRKSYFTFFAYFTTLFSGGLVPWYILCTQYLHLHNTFAAMFVPSLISVWDIIILRTFISVNIPDALIEAAKIDGCSEFRIFWQIVVPLSKAGIATIALFRVLVFWNDYYLPMMLISDSKLYNLQYYLQVIFLNIQILAQNSSAANSTLMQKVPMETTRFAMCVLTMGPILFIYPFFQKYFIKGMVIGSVKG